MPGEARFRDHGRMIELPPSCIVVNSSCKACEMKNFSSRLEAGSRVAGTFGHCPRCGNGGMIISISVDFDKLQEHMVGQVEIAWRSAPGGGK